MGVSLYYRITAPVDEAVRTAIEQSVIGEDHPWWCESVEFDDFHDGLVGGSTKLLYSATAMTHDGKVELVDFGDDIVMAWNDCQFIIGELGVLSRRFGLTWLIDLDGDLLGHVTPEGPDTMLQEAMGGFLETAGPDIGEDEAAATVARLRARYPSQGLMYRQTNEASLQPEDSKSSDPRPKPLDTFGWAFKPR